MAFTVRNSVNTPLVGQTLNHSGTPNSMLGVQVVVLMNPLPWPSVQGHPYHHHPTSHQPSQYQHSNWHHPYSQAVEQRYVYNTTNIFIRPNYLTTEPNHNNLIEAFNNTVTINYYLNYYLPSTTAFQLNFSDSLGQPRFSYVWFQHQVNYSLTTYHMESGLRVHNMTVFSINSGNSNIPVIMVTDRPTHISQQY